MNIREAKEEIIRTVRAYQQKDSAGISEIPPEQQRPVLLMGPPGIGKTAIMQQVAEACHINLVSYTITHHTRQSAIGLPLIAHQNFGGKDYAVTEYTMSEIVASVYEKMEKTGIREGILFLDEINCASETLAPTMLQFLQYKTFGTHRVPDGWIIVTAGNPPQYNRSAREFDIVTLDRVKRMDIEADFGVWKEYAARTGIHGAILTYLEMKQQHFYVIRTELDGRHFVTARGWEDLSRMLTACEKMREPVTERLVIQYLQDAEIARDFTLYYDLYNKYRDTWHVTEILAGMPVSDPDAIRGIPFDEKFSLIRLLADGLHQEFMQASQEEAVQRNLYGHLVNLRDSLQENDGREREDADFADRVRETGSALRLDLQTQEDASLLSRENARNLRLTCLAWDELTELILQSAAGEGNHGGEGFSAARQWFSEREEARQHRIDETNQHLTNAFSFLDQVYGTSQEMVMFLSELNADWHCLQFVRSVGNKAYSHYNRILLLRDRQEQLQGEIRRGMYLE